MIRELSRTMLAVWIVCTFIAATATPAFGQVPARFYWKSLIGARAVPILGMSLGGNARGRVTFPGVVRNSPREPRITQGSPR